MKAPGWLTAWPAWCWTGAAGIMIAPFYVLPSGLPQPSGAFAALTVVLLVADGRGQVQFPARAVPALTTLFALVVYIAITNFVWTGITGYSSISMNSAYYAYNSAVLVTTVAGYARFGARFLHALVRVAVASLLLQVVLSPFVFVPGQLRQELFYNNSNQLAYFAILVGSMFFAGARIERPDPRLEAVVYASVVYLALLSVSRAAFGSVLLLIGLALLNRPRSAIIVFGAIVSGLVTLEYLTDFLGAASERLSNLDPGTGRGYDRIANHPEYLVFGAGEGMSARFESEAVAHELHSIFGALLFSYGLPGIGLFVLLLVQILRLGRWSALMALGPTFIYGLAHQGLRFTQLWLLLGLVIGVGLELSKRRAAAAPRVDARGQAGPRRPNGMTTGAASSEGSA